MRNHDVRHLWLSLAHVAHTNNPQQLRGTGSYIRNVIKKSSLHC